MAKIGERVIDGAFRVLEANPEGVRWSDLVRQTGKTDSALKPGTIVGFLGGLCEQYPDRVYKPSRGLYRLTKYRDARPQGEPVGEQPKKVKEEDFYRPFADWLVNDVEECTKAIALGGKKFKDKWGTPDVIGKRESKKSDIIEAPIEIVSAEIKTDASELVTAFGQACAYCLFSHKAYLVVADSAPDDEIARLDALCQVFGIGLVLFDSEKPEDPQFSIRARPRCQQPDLFYANRYMKLIEAELFS